MIGVRLRCPECQARVSAKARWCPGCGTELPQPAVLPEPAEPEALEESPAAATGTASSKRASLSPRSWSAPQWVSVVLAVLLVVVLAVGALAFFAERNSTVASNKQQTASSVRDAVLSRASEASIKAYTVTAVTHEKDNAAAETLMTAKMAAKYSGQVTAAQWKTLAAGGAKQTSKVAADGVTSMTKDTAHVFVLIVVSTTAKNTSSNSVVAYRLNVTLVDRGGNWLVDDMNVIF
ncbi:hypothetical protein Back2_26980 [Nocardioides baekrokdamisoli]|uniref:Zinc-ribbon domain-containing protein n=2 Tax=Nocardioides baekrokdamisoli TaxID=1804624 RepID=A0A3G9IXI7_9ACTN|nr:hypothetical protein Back2_26980 [Nocardioides baekrokdamisoli]